MLDASPFPHIVVKTNLEGLTSPVRRAPGVVAVVGTTPDDDTGGVAPVGVPQRIETIEDAETAFAGGDPVQSNGLVEALRLVFRQDPRPSKIYGVRAANDDFAAALSGLEAADDVTFVALAGVTDVGSARDGATAPTGLNALKDHVETMSDGGQARVGVAMVDPAIEKSPSYVADVVATLTAAPNSLRSDGGRMILVAARGARQDAAVAAMAAIAGHAPHVSRILKPVRGLQMPLEQQYSPGEIKSLGEEGINAIIDPTLIAGDSLHFADNRTFTGTNQLQQMDVVFVIDQITALLRNRLIGEIGNRRTTIQGTTRLAAQIDRVLSPLRRGGVIDGYAIDIPLANALALPASTRGPADTAVIEAARQTRTAQVNVSVLYGPAIHLLTIDLAPSFV